MGSLHVVTGGVEMAGASDLSAKLTAGRIVSRTKEDLSISGYYNLTVYTATENDNEGHTLFETGPEGTAVGAETLTVTGSDGATFSGSVETPLLFAEDIHELRVESVTRDVRVEASEEARVEARDGDITTASLHDISLVSPPPPSPLPQLPPPLPPFLSSPAPFPPSSAPSLSLLPPLPPSPPLSVPSHRAFKTFTSCHVIHQEEVTFDALPAASPHPNPAPRGHATLALTAPRPAAASRDLCGRWDGADDEGSPAREGPKGSAETPPPQTTPTPSPPHARSPNESVGARGRKGAGGVAGRAPACPAATSCSPKYGIMKTVSASINNNQRGKKCAKIPAIKSRNKRDFTRFREQNTSPPHSLSPPHTHIERSPLPQSIPPMPPPPSPLATYTQPPSPIPLNPPLPYSPSPNTKTPLPCPHTDPSPLPHAPPPLPNPR
ncbi:zeta-sarcoglycan-like protein [Penaeus vannamei]|uniref:Zeta-sarcoglycan-like protein n=1 Tax=Penaeus vannamei TaxID=6689 RepID=A0A3R7Q1F4_PENVA|nr:zeta-sarcoglycan-like protein [Penaeus vannamei]